MADLSSTAETFVSFAEDFFGVEKPFDATVAEATICFIKLGQMDDQWDALRTEGKSLEIPVQDLLDMLGKATIQDARKSFDALSKDATPLLSRSQTLEETTETVFAGYQTRHTETLARLKAVWMATDSSSQEKQDLLTSARETCQSCKTTLEGRQKERNAMNTELDDFAWLTYRAIPNKDSVPPTSFTPSIRLKAGNSST